MKYRLTITTKDGKQHRAEELTDATLRVWLASFLSDENAESFLVERSAA